MVLHAIRIIIIIFLILLVMFYPFFPGRYDSSAITLSIMSQLFSFVGLLLVPIGLAWIISELMRWKLNTYFINATFVVMGIIIIMVCIGAISFNDLLLGIIFLVISLMMLIKFYKRVSNRSTSGNQKFSPMPAYLVVIPVIVAAARIASITPAVEFSRNFAIRKSENLIRDIESFYKKNGHYPVSLQALHGDYSPSVVGISEYLYEQNGTAYNLYFKQFSDELPVEEIVMYNKNDEHHFAAHAKDILEFTGEELALRRGDRLRYKLSTPHWIYFKFD